MNSAVDIVGFNGVLASWFHGLASCFKSDEIIASSHRILCHFLVLLLYRTKGPLVSRLRRRRSTSLESYSLLLAHAILNLCKGYFVAHILLLLIFSSNVLRIAGLAIGKMRVDVLEPTGD